MPVFDYKCESCKKIFEVLQNNSKAFEVCSEINKGCEQNSSVKKMISNFAFSGFSISPSEFQNATKIAEPQSKGCACHGSTNCSGSSIRSKYGID